MKVQRQAKLMELIQTERIETQEELSSRLRALGFDTTQATISRDIKELRLVKVLADNGVYKYAPPPHFAGDGESDYRLKTIFREGVVRYDAAQNIIVLKTLPGLANAACAAIDAMTVAGVVGTLAGDDTALLVMRDNAAASEFCHTISQMLAAAPPQE